VISDTHLDTFNDELMILNHYLFNDVDMILHCGDVTKPPVLYPFLSGNLKCVSGNMDSVAIRSVYPFKEEIDIFSFKILLLHGSGYGAFFYETISNEYPYMDIYVYGHTHKPEIFKTEKTVFFNPGSFFYNRSSFSKRSVGVIEFESMNRVRFKLINIENIADKKFTIIEDVKWEKQ